MGGGEEEEREEVVYPGVPTETDSDVIAPRRLLKL